MIAGLQYKVHNLEKICLEFKRNFKYLKQINTDKSQYDRYPQISMIETNKKKENLSGYASYSHRMNCISSKGYV